MSFKLFGIEFDGNKDSNSVGKKKMDKVCQRIGEKLIREWIRYGEEEGKIDRDEVNDLYKWIKVLEEVNYKNLNNLKEETDGDKLREDKK